MELATAKDFEEPPLVDWVTQHNKQLSSQTSKPGRETATFNALPAGIAHPTIEDAAVWIDKFGESVELVK
jgi:hypothetical protein